MKVEEVVRAADEYLGRQVCVSGRIISDLKTVIAAVGDLQDFVVLESTHDLQERLLEVVPCRLGGPALYNELGRVVGQFDRGEAGYIIRPTLLEIYRAVDGIDTTYRIDMSTPEANH